MNVWMRWQALMELYLYISSVIFDFDYKTSQSSPPSPAVSQATAHIVKCVRIM